MVLLVNLAVESHDDATGYAYAVCNVAEDILWRINAVKIFKRINTMKREPLLSNVSLQPVFIPKKVAELNFSANF